MTTTLGDCVGLAACCENCSLRFCATGLCVCGCVARGFCRVEHTAMTGASRFVLHILADAVVLYVCTTVMQPRAHTCHSLLDKLVVIQLFIRRRCFVSIRMGRVVVYCRILLSQDAERASPQTSIHLDSMIEQGSWFWFSMIKRWSQYQSAQATVSCGSRVNFATDQLRGRSMPRLQCECIAMLSRCACKGLL